MPKGKILGDKVFGDKLLARALYRLERARRPATWGKSMTTTTEIHPVDQILPTPRLLALGLQHVLVMYAGAVAVPLIIGRALKLPPEDVAFLISADLFACGIATLVQCIGFPGVGIRLPVMMGVTFASVGPMLSMAAAPDIGLLGIYGSVIAAGIFAIVAAPFISRLLPLFPPVVTGTIILVIGISLMRVGINWAGGGLPTLTKVVDGVPGAFPNPAYGQLQGLGIALFVLLVILGLIKWGSGFVANVAVLLGIVAGAVLASGARRHAFREGRGGAMGRDRAAAAFRDAAISARPHHHHVHRDDRGDDRIARHVPGARRDHRQGDRPRRADPRLARRRRRHAARRAVQHLSLYVVLAECRPGRRHRRALALGHVAGGGIMLLLGLLPKMAALVEAVPLVVLGGAGLVMFGMVAATGARILTAVDFKNNRYNLFVVAISVGFGMIPLVAPNFFKQPAARPAPVAGIRHPALRAGRGGAERLLQRRRQQGRRGGRRRVGRGLGDASGWQQRAISFRDRSHSSTA